jgi:hypothetical protein
MYNRNEYQAFKCTKKQEKVSGFKVYSRKEELRHKVISIVSLPVISVALMILVKFL